MATVDVNTTANATRTKLPAIKDKIHENMVESIFTNPFILPGDDQIFRIREEEKRKKVTEATLSKTKSVWDKGGDPNKSRAARLAELMGEDARVASILDVTSKATGQDVKVAPPIRRNEKENMTEYIGKKREMFLVQMSLDTKREEIRKLEEKAQAKEEALQRSERMLEEDALRFDTFLQENDKKAHDAIKRADDETKKKQEKIQEIKRLTQQIQSLSSEMSKHKESLEDCMKYKAFLDMLTPAEWFEDHAKKLEAQRAAIQKERFDVKYKDWDKVRRRLVEQHRKEMEARKDDKKGKKKSAADDDEQEPEQRLVIPPAPKLEDEIVPPIEEEPPMYFNEPHQLMDIFASLEEQNLFLIQNSQETERTLEELQHTFKETKTTMAERTGQITTQINELQAQIAAEEQRSKQLQQKRLASLESESGSASRSTSTANNVSQQEKERLLEELNTKVRTVYKQCGFEASSNTHTLLMLTQLESKLESLLHDIDKMPQDYVIRAEKEKEKRRRERKREEQQALHLRQQEERNRRAIERSMQAPKKRTGRQVMYRSRPLQRKEVVDTSDQDTGATDEAKYLQ